MSTTEPQRSLTPDRTGPERPAGRRSNLSESKAGQLVATSVTVTSRLPQTLMTLAEGRLDMPRVEIIAKHAGALADEHYLSARRAGLSPAVAEAAAREIAERLEEQILKRAVRQTTAGLGNSLTTAIARLDPEYASRKAAENVRGRFVSFRPNPADGTGDLFARMPLVEGAVVYDSLDAYARLLRSQGDERTLDQLRTDTLSYLVIHGHLPEHDPRRPQP
jgi:hypothetical protein